MDCPMSSCAAPVGSPCRTGKGKVAVQYHTARFRLVPSLAKALNVPTPAARRPGSAWVELPRPAVAGTGPAGHVRIGYARASTSRVPGPAQLDDLLPGGVLGRCPRRTGAGVEEESGLPRPEVPDQRPQRRRRVPRPRRRLLDRHAFVQVAAQRFVAAVVRPGRPRKEVTTRSSR